MAEKWTSRGSGVCPSCKTFKYVNRHKPVECPVCKHALGGSFTGPKKLKTHVPEAVEVAKNLFSVRTSNRGDRCLVCKDGDLWICLHQQCIQRRASFHESAQLDQFSCEHIKKTCSLESALPCQLSNLADSIVQYPCGQKVKSDLQSIIHNAAQNGFPVVVKVSSNVYCVYGPPTASNTVGYCHVKYFEQKQQFSCCGQDCRSMASKGKHSRTKAICIHLHMLYCSTKLQGACPAELHVGEDAISENTDGNCDEEPVGRQSTIRLAERNTNYTYEVPRMLLRKIMEQDACSMCGIPGGWPKKFSPAIERCGLCGEKLGEERKHSGQRGSVYLVSELNAFQHVDVFVKVCNNPECRAMNQAGFYDYGKCNLPSVYIIIILIVYGTDRTFDHGQQGFVLQIQKFHNKNYVLITPVMLLMYLIQCI